MKELVLVGETLNRIRFNSIEELRDLVRSLPKDQRGGLFGNSQKAAVNPMAGGYESYVNILMGDAAFDTEAEVVALATAAAGLTRRIWEFTVPARFMYTWGSGAYGLINNQGYFWFVTLDIATGFQVNRVQFGVESNDRHKYAPVKEFIDTASHLADFTTLATATPTNNQTGMLALPQTTVIAMPWSRLAITVTVIAAQAGLDHAGFNIPVTVKSS